MMIWSATIDPLLIVKVPLRTSILPVCVALVTLSVPPVTATIPLPVHVAEPMSKSSATKADPPARVSSLPSPSRVTLRARKTPFERFMRAVPATPSKTGAFVTVSWPPDNQIEALVPAMSLPPTAVMSVPATVMVPPATVSVPWLSTPKKFAMVRAARRTELFEIVISPTPESPRKLVSLVAVTLAPLHNHTTPVRKPALPASICRAESEPPQTVSVAGAVEKSLTVNVAKLRTVFEHIIWPELDKPM